MRQQNFATYLAARGPVWTAFFRYCFKKANTPPRDPPCNGKCSSRDLVNKKLCDFSAVATTAEYPCTTTLLLLSQPGSTSTSPRRTAATWRLTTAPATLRPHRCQRQLQQQAGKPTTTQQVWMTLPRQTPTGMKWPRLTRPPRRRPVDRRWMFPPPPGHSTPPPSRTHQFPVATRNSLSSRLATSQTIFRFFSIYTIEFNCSFDSGYHLEEIITEIQCDGWFRTCTWAWSWASTGAPMMHPAPTTRPSVLLKTWTANRPCHLSSSESTLGTDPENRYREATFTWAQDTLWWKSQYNICSIYVDTLFFSIWMPVLLFCLTTVLDSGGSPGSLDS